ncbi:glycosyl hydrolase [Kitasatospora phosalacinea]|uniref:glycosyl hydrolase n=1 Tax=Kitasatospora phosalacinea TaxID=2065 RepID=UPI00068EBF88|nr:glycosyl hydrolase [Kitasatospora phosalacinea]
MRTPPGSTGPRRRLTAAATACALGVGLLTATAASAAAAPADHRPPSRTVDISDPDATAETRSLFSYLRDGHDSAVLFGHQQTTEFGVTFAKADGTASDVLAGVGDHPAVYGWDMSDQGYGSSPGTPEEKFDTYVELIEDAHRTGGINTISAHMNNFVTGGNYGDTNGNVVQRILPGGDHNADFTAYLDRVARLAHSITDDDGHPIPVVFRPFHENSGSWFWWGAAHASPSQYVELWRYTVEYLRDTKDVHNFLYAYSPGGGYGGSDDVYLRTYPGDDYVDVLGYDNYDGTDGSQQWRNAVVTDLGMLARMAEEHGKVSAFTEFGESGGLKPNGHNGDLQWYTQLLDAIAADKDAARTAYMMTWTNFSTDQFFVPYPAHGDLPDHELLADFRAFAADPRSLFSSDLNARDVFGRQVRAERHAPSAHAVSPTDGQRITTPSTTVRVRVADAKPKQVYFTVGDDPTRHPLRLDAATGYYTGTWDIGAANLDNTITTLKVRADLPGHRTLAVDHRVALGEKPPLPAGVVDDFEGYVDDTDLRSAYSPYGTNTISLSHDPVGSGTSALRFDYDFGFQNYTGIGRRLDGDWSAFTGLSMWLKPDGSRHKLVLQLVAGGIAYEAYPSMAGTEGGTLRIPFSDFRPAPWDTAHADRRITPQDLADLSQFNVFVNQADTGTTTRGSFYLDDLRAG